MSGAGAHFSFLVHSPNVMKECASPPLPGMGRDPLHPPRSRRLLEWWTKVSGAKQGLWRLTINRSEAGRVAGATKPRGALPASVRAAGVGSMGGGSLAEGRKRFG